MVKSLMKIVFVLFMSLFLLLPGDAGERTLADYYQATAGRMSLEGDMCHVVRINGEVVFVFPQGTKSDNAALETQAIADEMNALLITHKDYLSIEPYLDEDQVVIKIAQHTVVRIDDELAGLFEQSSTELALTWTDKITSIMSRSGDRMDRRAYQRGGIRVQRGRASWYGGSFHGRRTANGETFDKNALTAAHRTLPFGTVVLVTNLNNGKSVIVRINDRGPFSPTRHIDLSKRAAEDIEMIRSGTAPVKIEILTSPSLADRN